MIPRCLISVSVVKHSSHVPIGTRILLICLVGFQRHFQRCIGHITTGSFMGSTYSGSRFCTAKCQPSESNYQLSHIRSGGLNCQKLEANVDYWDPNMNQEIFELANVMLYHSSVRAISLLHVKQRFTYVLS